MLNESAHVYTAGLEASQVGVLLSRDCHVFLKVINMDARAIALHVLLFERRHNSVADKVACKTAILWHCCQSKRAALLLIMMTAQFGRFRLNTTKSDTEIHRQTTPYLKVHQLHMRYTTMPSSLFAFTLLDRIGIE